MSETMYYFWLCGMRCVSSDVPPAHAHVELIAEYRPEDDAFISEYIRNGAMSHPRFEPARLDGMLTTIDYQFAGITVYTRKSWNRQTMAWEIVKSLPGAQTVMYDSRGMNSQWIPDPPPNPDANHCTIEPCADTLRSEY